MLSNILLTTAVLVAAAVAEYPSARVAVETKSGDNNSLKNTTISIELNNIYKNPQILHDVSALYLIGATGAQMDTISCTPFFNSQGSGEHATHFTSNTVSHVSSGESIGSIVCISTGISQAPGGGLGNPGGSSTTPTFGAPSSTTLVTHTPHMHGTQTTSAGTGYTVSSQSKSGPTAATASTSPTASQSAGNAAGALYLSGEFFGGLALAGFGVAFAL